MYCTLYSTGVIVLYTLLVGLNFTLYWWESPVHCNGGEVLYTELAELSCTMYMYNVGLLYNVPGKAVLYNVKVGSVLHTVLVELSYTLYWTGCTLH